MAILVLLFGASLFLGSTKVSFHQLFVHPGSQPTFEHQILMQHRLPRTLTALLGGAALSLSGLLMQTLFRNPLAGPAVLGITAGSSLGVALIMLSSFTYLATGPPIVISAIAGALSVLAIILMMARRFSDITSVLIVGLMLSFFASALVSLLQSFATEGAIKAFVFWGFGSFSEVSNHELVFFSVSIAVTVVISMFLIKPLNALLLGEMYASSMGYNTKVLRLKIMLATGILTGTVTAFCGPVAFLGLISPHIARFAFKTIHINIIFPASLLLGSALALVCDILSRLPGSELAVPLNTVCACMGAPVVVYLILSGRKRKILL